MTKVIYDNILGKIREEDEGSGDGTSYENLKDKPSINGVTLEGDLTSEDLGLHNGYINADTVEELPNPSSVYQSKIGLVPSVNVEGSLDYYICTENDGVWDWVLIGSTSPIIAVQQVDSLKNLVVDTILTGTQISTTNGNEFSNANVNTYVFNIPINATKIYVTFLSINNSSQKFVHFYDYNGFMEGESQLGNTSSTNIQFEKEEINIPNGAKVVKICANRTSSSCVCAVEQFVEQELIKQIATPNEIIYGEVDVNSDIHSSVSSSSEMVVTTRKSGYGIMFPSTYTNIGRPTQVIAMLHGSAGYVSPQCLGYLGSYLGGEWVNWRKQYLSAGFAVMDINGYGVSLSNDQYSKPFGNPQMVETLFKSFNVLKELYNISDKLLLHGTSMGGANAMSYLLNHADTVAGVGLFAPALVPYYVHIIVPDKGYTGADVATSWGYTNWSAMDTDGCSKLIGYSPMMEDDFDWVNMSNEEYLLLTAKTKLANVPIRIWHGTADNNIPYSQSEKLVDLLHRNNIPVTLRLVDGAAHNMSGGAVDYVRNEAVSWFKRFVNS